MLAYAHAYTPYTVSVRVCVCVCVCVCVYIHPLRARLRHGGAQREQYVLLGELRVVALEQLAHLKKHRVAGWVQRVAGVALEQLARAPGHRGSQAGYRGLQAGYMGLQAWLSRAAS